MLMQRGAMITAGNQTKVIELTNKINKYAEENSEKLSKPVAAFITFENSEGMKRAIHYFPDLRKLKQTSN
jgi:hypothetical protein